MHTLHIFSSARSDKFAVFVGLCFVCVCCHPCSFLPQTFSFSSLQQVLILT